MQKRKAYSLLLDPHGNSIIMIMIMTTMIIKILNHDNSLKK